MDVSITDNSNEDKQELLLRKSMLETRYAYIQYIMPKALKEFSDRLIELNKIYRKGKPEPIFESNCCDSNVNGDLTEFEEKELKIIYHKLCRIHHPDRNNNQDNDMIRKINELYQSKNLVGLKQLLEHLDDMVDVMYLAELEKEIRHYECTVQYQWKTTKSQFMKSYYESEFLTPEEKEEETKREQLLKEAESLQDKLKDMMKKNDKSDSSNQSNLS